MFSRWTVDRPWRRAAGRVGRLVTGEARTLLMMMVLFAAAGSFVGIFLNIFLLRATESVPLIIATAISFSVATLAAYLLGTRLLSTFNVAVIFRAGLLFTLLYHLLILVLRDWLNTVMLPLGAVNGFGVGLYWCAFNLLLARLIDDEARGKFFGLQNVFNQLFGIFIPTISGFIIVTLPELTGYYVLFSGAVSLLLVAFALSFKLSGFKAQRAILPLRVLVQRGNAYWDTNKWYNISWGFSQNLRAQVFVLLAFAIVGSELRIGNYQTAAALLSFVSAMWITRRITPRNRENIHLAAALVNLAALVSLALFANQVAVLLAFLLTGAVNSWADNISQTTKFQLSVLAESLAHSREEYLVATEFPLALGRVLGLLVALGVVAVLPIMTAYRVLMFVSAFFWLGNHVLIKRKTNWLASPGPVNTTGPAAEAAL